MGEEADPVHSGVEDIPSRIVGYIQTKVKDSGTHKTLF
jgi:hypothetical protein